MTSAIVRCSRKAQLWPTGTSRAAMAVSTSRQGPCAGKPITASRGSAQAPHDLQVAAVYVAGQIAGLGVAPQGSFGERCDLFAELLPGPAARALRHAGPEMAEGAVEGVTALSIERAAGPARGLLRDRHGNGTGLRVLRDGG